MTPVTNATPTPATAPPPAVARRNQASPAAKARAELRTAVNEVVGSVFLGPLLRAARASTIKGEFGHGGRGEEIFQAQLDQTLTERAGTATRYPLSDVLFDRLAPAAIAHQRGTNA